VKFGVSTFVTDEGIGPAALGRALEERGFDSLWVAEHTHIPVRLETPWPGGVPRRYMRTLDPFVTLGVAAGSTSNLLVGTGICLLIERDPITTANEVASVDHVSSGRFLFGVGAGWRLEEMRNHGTDPSTRLSLLGERLAAMKQIWTEDEAEYHGRFVDFDPIRSWPKPVQEPHPPIYFGGEGPGVIRKLLEHGDAWLPRAAVGADRLAEQIAEVQNEATAHGRGPLPITVFGVPAEADKIEALGALDVERLLLYLPTQPEEETLRTLDEFAKLTER
jgi:probable F420-dependent oxidoreductase